jgi:hypothetical protein
MTIAFVEPSAWMNSGRSRKPTKSARNAASSPAEEKTFSMRRTWQNRDLH